MKALLDKALRYRRVHGTRQLVRAVIAMLRVGQPATSAGNRVAVPVDDAGWVNARELVKAHRAGSTPLRLFTVPATRDAVPRVSLVTDSIIKGSLYGGVGTAIIMSALVAEARGAQLRIVTRTERPHQAGLEAVLRTYGIALSREVEFAHAPCYDRGYSIDVMDRELFITSSWWTTASTLGSVPPAQVVYLLQEDERMFYPLGDEHLLCSRTLERSDIRFVVNSQMLFEHLKGSGLQHLSSCGEWFEPAFPPSVFHPRSNSGTGRRTLMLYARPHNQRNLFLFGIELIEAAITRGVLDLDDWDVVLLGKDIPKIRLDDGRYSPRRLENLNWDEYADFVGRVDLGVSLMYTPHPSYPPFDLAASGAVVVTNRFGLKRSLGHYSRNILCGDLAIEPMLEVLAEGITLASNPVARESNYRANTIGTDWRQSFARVVERFGRHL